MSDVPTPDPEREILLEGGNLNPGAVIRVGDTVRRPRNSGSDLVEALLIHLADAGYERAPRFRGIDSSGRQVLDFVPGAVTARPRWLADDVANAAALGRLAQHIRDLHEAAESFVPPEGSRPVRPPPMTGSTWSHCDVGYANSVYRGDELVAFIDWEFAAQTDPVYDLACLLHGSTRAPKLGAPDNDRRAEATRRALTAIAEGYGLSDEKAQRLPKATATLVDNAIQVLQDHGVATDVERMRWRSRWFRENSDGLIA